MTIDRAIRNYKSVTYVGRTLDVARYNDPEKVIAYRTNVEEKGPGNMKPITLIAKKQTKQAKDFENSRQ